MKAGPDGPLAMSGGLGCKMGPNPPRVKEQGWIFRVPLDSPRLAIYYTSASDPTEARLYYIISGSRGTG